MKKINTNFSIIGTNPSMYLDNYTSFFNGFLVGEHFYLDKRNHWVIDDNQKIIFQCQSDTTLRQNVDCWVGLGLMAKRNNDVIVKIMPQMTSDMLIESIKIILLLESNDPLINTYRNTILIKLLSMHFPDKIKKIVFNGKSREIFYDDILKEIGKFEKKLSLDREYISIIEGMWMY